MTEKETGMAARPHTAGELAQYLGCPIEGDAEVQLRGVSSPERAGPEDLIYVDSPRNLERAERSGARCVITSSALRIFGKTLLLAPQPKFAFARAPAVTKHSRRSTSGSPRSTAATSVRGSA